MERRSFLLGTFASGLAFLAKPILDLGPKAPIKLAEGERLDRWLRAFQLPETKLRKFKIGYNMKNDACYQMPEVVKITKTIGKIDFLAPQLKIASTAIFTGCKLIDDENYILADRSFLSDVSVVPGDSLIVTSSLIIEWRGGDAI